jgi:hypothetical protein
MAWSFDDYLKGRDTVLDAVFAHIDGH